MSVRIFGHHDEATVAQIHRCMAVGGARAVLCADGHKGYAQPIGGVIAYRDLVSISGVGFDIACGNLAIRTNATGAAVITPSVSKPARPRALRVRVSSRALSSTSSSRMMLALPFLCHKPGRVRRVPVR